MKKPQNHYQKNRIGGRKEESFIVSGLRIGETLQEICSITDNFHPWVLFTIEELY